SSSRMAPAMSSVTIRASGGTSSSGIAWLLASGVATHGASLRLRQCLLGGLALVELGGPGLDGGDAEGLLQELAGGEAVAAGIALGLDSRLAAGRDRDLDGPGHGVSSSRCDGRDGGVVRSECGGGQGGRLVTQRASTI